MKLSTSLLFFCTLFLSQTLSVFAFPIKIFEKRRLSPGYIVTGHVLFKKPEDWSKDVYVYVYNSKDGKELNQWPGSKMYANNYDEYYRYELYINYYEKYDSIIFSERNGRQIPGVMQKGFDLVMDGIYDATGLLGINTKNESIYYISNISKDGFQSISTTTYGNIARIYYSPKEGLFDGDIYAHYKIGNGEWNSIPGDKLIPLRYHIGNYYYLFIDLKDAKDLTITFTDGKNWDNNNRKDYKFKSYSNFIINNRDKN